MSFNQKGTEIMDFERILKQVEELLTKAKTEYSAGHIDAVGELLSTMLTYLFDEIAGIAPDEPESPTPERTNP